MNYTWNKQTIDSVELKSLLVSRGLKVDKDVYRQLGKTYRIYPNALTCNCLLLPDDTICMATDLGFHLSTLSSMFSWDNLKLLKYMNDMTTDFQVVLDGDQPVLLYQKEPVTPIRFLPGTDFYLQKTSSGMPYAGNAVLQGREWVAFQCLWPCEYAQAGYSCQYCFSGGQFESLAKRKKPMPFIPSPQDVREVSDYAAANCHVTSMEITGGSTFDAAVEEKHITSYLDALQDSPLMRRKDGEILLFITPPKQTDVLDRYFALGADRIACSIEVWDETLASEIMPGKHRFTGRERHLQALTYIAEKYGPGKAFSNFIIGLEPIESLTQGATYLAERGIIPTASVWMPFGKPVRGSMKPPELDYYRRTKEMLAGLYEKYQLQPPGGSGLNVCIDADIKRWCSQS